MNKAKMPRQKFPPLGWSTPLASKKSNRRTRRLHVIHLISTSYDKVWLLWPGAERAYPNGRSLESGSILSTLSHRFSISGPVGHLFWFERPKGNRAEGRTVRVSILLSAP